MEEICFSLANTLCSSGMGGYKIFYEEELLEALPEDMRNRETLEAALKNLTGGGYIDVKYARGSAFCIACNRKYELAPKIEKTVDAEAAAPAEAVVNIPKKIYAVLALSAFAGGALSGCLAAVLGAVL